ncbi:MAG: translation initiation factor IF-3 [Chitinophagales bacterium]
MADFPSSSKPGNTNNKPNNTNSNNRPGGGGNTSRPGGNTGPSRPGGPGGARPGGPYRPSTGTGPKPGGQGGRMRQGPRQVVAEHRINDFIRGVAEMRLIGDNMDEISELLGKTIEPGIYDTVQLREWSEECGLDLVEISPNAAPPVARIVDYNKFLYQKKKKEKELKANTFKQQLKEIRFGPETGEHDFEFKLRHAKSFLEEGNKVKAYVQFRGRAIVFKDRGELLLLRFIKELEESGLPEQMPKLEGKKMQVIIAPKKTPGKKS